MRCSNEQHLTMVLMLLLTVQPTGSSTQQGSEDARGHQDVHELRRTQARNTLPVLESMYFRARNVILISLCADPGT